MVTPTILVSAADPVGDYTASFSPSVDGLVLLGRTAFVQFQEALELYEEGIRRCREVGDRSILGYALNSVAQACLGAVVRLLGALDRGIHVFHIVMDGHRTAFQSLGRLGLAAAELGEVVDQPRRAHRLPCSCDYKRRNCC